MQFNDQYFDREQLAAFLGKSVRTVIRMDAERTGPPITRVGKTPIYRRDSVLEWLESLEERQVRAGR